MQVPNPVSRDHYHSSEEVTSPRGDVGDVTFREQSFSQYVGAIAFAINQKATLPTSPTSPPFLGPPFFSSQFEKKTS
jgi:hypothetical protein